MKKSGSIFSIGWLCLALCQPATAQVFSAGQAPAAPRSATTAAAPTFKAAPEPEKQLDEMVKLPPREKPAEVNNDDSFSPVETNFSGERQEVQKAPDNKDEPTVFHFKIVNGKVNFINADKRNILVYYDDYKIHRGFDKIIKCTIRVYVVNDLTEKISTLAFRLKWPDISTTVLMNQLNPGVKTYTDLMLLGDGCLKLDHTPTIEVNRCRVKGMSQEACADAIKWFPKQ